MWQSGQGLAFLLPCPLSLLELGGARRGSASPPDPGFLLDFISYPVIKGFTSAAAVTIAFGQVKVGPVAPACVGIAQHWEEGLRGSRLAEGCGHGS